MDLPRAACFSPCGRYRWWLERCWDPQRPALLFIGLNPSRADAERDDPTLRRLQAFARAWGYGRLEVLNLFARIAASPASLRRSCDPIGPDNDGWLARRLLVQPAGAALWLGWGNGGSWRGRDRAVLQRLARLPHPQLVIGLTASGQPRHPLYARGDAQPLWLQQPGGQLRVATSS
jgi:hypothetical protein